MITDSQHGASCRRIHMAQADLVKVVHSES